MPQAIHRFTVDEYHRMGDAGIFHEDDRVELLDGQVVQMTPIGPAHQGCVDALTGLLSLRVGVTAIVRVQGPVVLEEHAEPQPDLAVLKPRADAYRGAHPRTGDVLLVIEVADTSPERDREVKIPLYAAAGISEAWLVDLLNQAVVVHRQPTPSGYRDVQTLRRGETLTPQELPGITLRVDAILG